jgi:hypothetical protein
MELLTEWTGCALKAANPDYGLGQWPSTITTKGVALAAGLGGVDHVAPPVAKTPEGEVVRGFAHRTLLEHFAVRFLAQLPAPDAQELLLPHLWFDPDWNYVAPAAIARHKSKNKLLTSLLKAAKSPLKDPPHAEANRALELTIARVTSHSDPTDWQPANQQTLTNLWLGHLTDSEFIAKPEAFRWTPDGAVRSQAIDIVIKELPNAAQWTAKCLVDGLVLLADTDERRTQAFDAITQALPSAGSGATENLVDGLARLADTPERRTQAIAAITQALPTA